MSKILTDDEINKIREQKIRLDLLDRGDRPELYPNTVPGNKYDHRREILISYLKMKVEEHDWHAVSDAANDLRVLEARCER